MCPPSRLLPLSLIRYTNQICNAPRENDAIAPLSLSQRCHLFSVVDFARFCCCCVVQHMAKAARANRKLAKQCKRNQLSAKLSTRAAQFRFQSQMQTNRCLCLCTCSDNKAQLSQRERKSATQLLVRSHARSLRSCARSLSFSLNCPSFPPPTGKTRSLIAHLSSCQQSETH